MSTPLADYRFADLLVATAAKTPTPGGGAIAGATGALACALAGMVVSYSVGKKDLAPHADKLKAHDLALAAARAEFLTLADADAAAYSALNALQKLAPSDPARAQQLPAAIDAAVAVPVRCLKLATDTAQRCCELINITNRHLRSDLVIAAHLADATAKASLTNVNINLPLLEDPARRATLSQEARALAATAAQLAAKVAAACA